MTLLFFFMLKSISFDLFALETQEVEKAPLYLSVGEQKLLSFPINIIQFSLGNRKLIHSIRPLNKQSKKQLLLKAVQVGCTDLWVKKEDLESEHRQICVEKANPRILPKNTKNLVSSLMEVEVISLNDKVLLRGIITSLNEARKIQALLDYDPKTVLNQSQLSEELLLELKSKLETFIKHTQLSESFSVIEKNGSLWLTGSVDNEKEKQKLEMQIHLEFPLIETKIDTYAESLKTVYFRIFLLELRKDSFEAFGLRWPEVFEHALNISTHHLNESINFELNIHALAKNGMAKILSQPEIAVQSPGQAELFAGGEIPIKSQGKFFSNTLWKPFGLTLKLNVQKTIGKKIRLEILTEVSQLDSNISLDETPGIRSNRMKTQVEAELGKPLLLSGLLQDNLRTQVKGLPGLSSIPVLGALFSSKEYLSEQSELVAVLLPHEALPMAKWSKEFPDGFIKGTRPPRRNWLSQSEIKALESHPLFPWNVFE